MTPSTAPHRYGSRTVAPIVDGVFDVPRTVLRHAGGPAALDALLARVRADDIRIPVNAFLLRGPEGVSLIDSGCGTAWGEAFGKLRPTLAEHGLTAAEIDRVILTHVHSDHALGLLDGEAAYFPRAEIWVPGTDWQFFRDPAQRAAAPEGKRGSFDLADRVAAAYAGRVREIGPGPVLPGLVLEPLPGHTPGHAGYRLEGPEGTLLIGGDALHFAGLQVADPDVHTEWDADAAQAVRTRRDLLDRVKRNGWRLAGSHIDWDRRVAG